VVLLVGRTFQLFIIANNDNQFAGTNEELRGDTIDAFRPSSKEDFTKFEEMLVKKICQVDVSDQ
jgi:hypothetical protein